MGRKVQYTDKPKRGPGRKARKQQEPSFTKFLPEEEKTLSSKQLKRAKNRAVKVQKFVERTAKVAKLDGKDEKNAQKGSKKRIFSDSEGEEGSKKLKLVMSDSEEEDGSTKDNGEMSSKKLKLFMSDSEGEEESDGAGEEADDFSSDEDDEKLPEVEREAKKLRKERKQIMKDSQAELAEESEKLVIEIPTFEEIQIQLAENPDMSTVHDRIADVISILNNFKQLRDGERSRSQYITILQQDLCFYYSYNEWMVEEIFKIIPISELENYFESNERPRPVTLRTNTLKARPNTLAQALINQGVNLEPLRWSAVGMAVYNSNVTLGATTQYLAGHYMMQGACSFLPVMTLAPQSKEYILDMCAAPGGKATHIAALMKNSGALLCNDFNKERTVALKANFHRMGVTNAAISCLDGRMIGKSYAHRFDRVLLDAPCSGTGIISKDPTVKSAKDSKDIMKCALMQKELILSAIDATNAKSKTGGYIVYSTCSILVEENEHVIDYALRLRNVQCVDTQLPSKIGVPGFKKMQSKRFHKDLIHTRRVYPHLNNMDGFFIALLKKTSNELPLNAEQKEERKDAMNIMAKEVEKERLKSFKQVKYVAYQQWKIDRGLATKSFSENGFKKKVITSSTNEGNDTSGKRVKRKWKTRKTNQGFGTKGFSENLTKVNVITSSTNEGNDTSGKRVKRKWKTRKTNQGFGTKGFSENLTKVNVITSSTNEGNDTSEKKVKKKRVTFSINKSSTKWRRGKTPMEF